MDSLAPFETQVDGQLLGNMARFCRLLRAAGMDVGTGRVMELVRAMDVIDVTNFQDFYYATRALLVSRKADLKLFDAAFELFWQMPSRGMHKQSVKISGSLPRKARPVTLTPPPSDRDQPPPKPDQPESQSPPAIETTATYSARSVLRNKDFAALTPEELDEVKRLIGSFVWNLGERQTRRHRHGGSERIDMRRSIRLNLRYGGEMVSWAYRQPAHKLRPLVLIADISGSMDSYTRLLMRFCYGVARSLSQPVEAFVFATKLTRITRQLRTRDVDLALANAGKTASDWSGGTRIGESLRTFNRVWGQRVLGRGAVAILISDGLDRGDGDLLAREMAVLRRSAHRLIWLNPLLGSADYEPIAYGMKAALPHVHDFMPIHNIASLEALAKHLASLGDRDASRRSNHARRAF